MKKMLNLAYCNECEDLVEFDIHDEILEEEYKGEVVRFRFKVGRCKCCGAEVPTDNEYSFRKSDAKIKAYEKAKGLITIEEISEIMEKYDVGKEVLADIAGFGKATIKRYFEGFIPAKEYSDILKRLLVDEKFFKDSVRKNKEKLKDVAYRKVATRCRRLSEIEESKTEQIVNYIISNLEEVTPLALQKLLSFSSGVNYALNGSRLIDESSQAWQHGPVYPSVYNKYKRYKYNPIDCGIKSTHGCMLSKVSKEELKAIDMVIKTFGLYSPKTLEIISHSQTPWIEKRIGYRADQACNEVIDEESIKKFYLENELNSEKQILSYIMDVMNLTGDAGNKKE